jgi:hypothetical protein
MNSSNNARVCATSSAVSAEMTCSSSSARPARKDFAERGTRPRLAGVLSGVRHAPGRVEGVGGLPAVDVRREELRGPRGGDEDLRRLEVPGGRLLRRDGPEAGGDDEEEQHEDAEPGPPAAR